MDWVCYRWANLNNSLSYNSGKFDGVVCLNALYAIDNPPKLLKEFWRVLKFGGLLVLANPKRNPKIKDVLISHWNMIRGLDGTKKLSACLKTLFSFPSLLTVIFLNFLFVKPNRQYHFIDENCLEEILRTAGFRVLALESVYGNTDVFAVATKAIWEESGCGNVFSVEMARSKEDIEAIHRLRYDVYCEEMQSLNPEDYPDKRERDYYDDFSVHFLLRKGNEVVGTLRLIRETPRGFLMEEEFSLPDNINRSRMLEPSRLVVLKNYRGGGLSYFLDKAAECWSRENGYNLWCLATRPHLLPARKLRGWKIKIIGNNKLYHNKEVVPLIRCL